MILKLVREFYSGATVPLAGAPSALIQKAIEIATVAKPSVVQRIVGSLVFDSWLSPAFGGVRGTTNNRRRLRFEADGLELDLMAVKEASTWSFTARIGGIVKMEPSAYKLIASQKPVMADQSGFFMWQSSTPPNRLTIQSATSVVEFEKIAWRIART